MKHAIPVILILITALSVFGIEESQRPEFNERAAYLPLKGVPDVIVSAIVFPDELQYGTTIDGIDLEITNIGKGPATGYIKVDVSIDSPELPACKISTPLGGGFGSAYLSQTTRSLRYTSILPGETIKTPTFMEQLRVRFPYTCQRPLTKDFTIIAEVNPKAGQGITPRGRLFESDTTNNVLEKKVRIVLQPKTIDYELKLVPGQTMFSLPVKDELSVHAFRQLTKCELYEYKGNEQAYKSRRNLDLDRLELVPIEEKIQPGRIYVAGCDRQSTVSFQGADPEPFNIKLNGESLQPVPTRAGMRGRRVYELFKGCSSSYGPGHDTRFFTYIPGIRNKAGKMATEEVVAYTPIVPGLVYIMYCGSSYGGVWDTTDDTRAKGAPYTTKEGTHPSRPRSIGTTERRPSLVGGGQYTGYIHTYKQKYGYRGLSPTAPTR